MTIKDDLKKVLLAGIGAIAVPAEKSKELVDELQKKGELTVEQAKILNEELKHQTVKKTSDSVDWQEHLNKMSAEEREVLKAKLAEMESTKHEAEENDSKQ